jgi:hypothetical protein
LSARYSYSPTLQIHIGKSRYRSTLWLLLCIATLCALVGILARGYPVLCLLLAPLAGGLLWRLRHDAMIGAQLHWRRGQWSLQQGDRLRLIVLSRRSTALPWVMYLVFSEPATGRGWQYWLYTDSAPADQLRRLRVRLALA